MKRQTSLHKLDPRGKPVCIGTCTRRSFIPKSALGLMGILLILEATFSNSRFYHGNKNKEEIYKQLDELVDKYYPLYGTCS